MESSLTVLVSCFCLTCFFISSAAVDILAATQSLRHGETLVSASENFELGFFQQKTGFWYLGIWYKKISTGTVVWVANRETPLNDTSGVLKFNERGDLVLLYQDNITVWSSNTSRIEDSPIAQILESGNLVVRRENDDSLENFLWQSFDHPGNTLLPGMKIGTTAAGLNLYLSAWKSIDDPSRGNHTFEFDSSGLEFVFKQGSDVKSRSGPWNGLRFSGMPYLRQNSIFTYSVVFNQRESYYTYQLVNMSVFTRIVLNPYGIIQRLTWIDRIKDWNIYMTGPADNCDTYALCGAYGNCDIGSTPVCGCLDGFVPKYQTDWDRADWSNGCVRRTQLDCQKGDGFRLFSNVKLPDMQNFLFNSSMNLEECKMKCLANCSCMAYANSDIRGKGSGCFIWFSNVTDIRQYKENGQDLYVRMASSEIGSDQKRHRRIIFVGSEQNKHRRIMLLSIMSTAMLLLGLVIGLIIWKKKRGRLFRPKKEYTPEERISPDNKKEDLEIPHFDLASLATATDNFSLKNMLGQGGFGAVYKGILDNGVEIAVKRLSQNSRQGLDEFKNEVNCIAKLQHRNLVKLLGYCTQLEEKMLIYEYMPNNSLDYYVFDQVRSTSLDWPKRFHIINGICRGLLYLHQDSRLKIIHRDLKLSNILLDNEMNPKISDFGIARVFGAEETEANTKRVVGTYGYMSPEYAIDGQFSIKSDVFSYGVLILEIVSGKRNRGFSHPDHHHNLLGHAWGLFNEGKEIELVDAAIVESCTRSEVLRSIHVGLLCVQKSPEDRPSMSTVVLMLGSDRILPMPNEPGFFTERNLIRTKSFGTMSESCSINEITVTMINPR